MLSLIAYFAAFLAALTCIVTGLANMPMHSFNFCIAAILCVLVGTITVGD